MHTLSPLRAQDGAHEAVVQSFLAIVRGVPGADVQWAQLEQRAGSRWIDFYCALDASAGAL